MDDPILYLALGVSLTGLVLLTFAAESLEPPYTNISLLGELPVGKSVHLMGNITRVHEFKGGSGIVTLSNGHSNVSVYLPYATMMNVKTKLKDGAEADVIGTLEVYKGLTEVVVEDAGNLRIE